jgi:hypothetical protein
MKASIEQKKVEREMPQNGIVMYRVITAELCSEVKKMTACEQLRWRELTQAGSMDARKC